MKMSGDTLRRRWRFEGGFGLIEVLVMIMVVGILVAVAMQSMTVTIDDTRREKTVHEMEALANAIVGNPALVAGGQRCDFGYVGDVGAFPPDLDALRINPGSYATWDGPYVAEGFTEDTEGYKLDEWGRAYNYSGGITITSTGGGTTLTRRLADASSDYLLNHLDAVIRDADDSIPGPIYCDSIGVEITFPNGAGGMTTKSYSPDFAGAFTLDSLPVGTHRLEIIYRPEVDTLHRLVTILPRHKSDEPKQYRFASAHFSTASSGDSMLTKVPGSDSIYTTGDCNNISFYVRNNTGAAVTVGSIRLTWSSPTAYYRYVNWDGTAVVNAWPNKLGSGETGTFSGAQTINDGSSVKVEIEWFRSSEMGAAGSDVNMSNTTFTVLFSDGSTFDVTVGACP